VEEKTDEKIPLNLSVDVKRLSACERHVTVTIPRSDIDRYFAKQFDELLPKAEVPGFRVGRAPRQLVENKFRRQVSDQVKGALLMDSLSQVGEEQEYSAISEPDLDFEQVTIPDDGDMTYEFNIEVRPDFELPQWKGLLLERPEHEFSDAEIDTQIAKLAAQSAQMVPVDEAVRAGDYIVCNITSRHEGKVVASIQEQTIQVRPILSFSDATIDGFEKMFMGAKAGETKTIQLQVSEFSENEELKGKSVDVEIEILDVKRVDTKSAADVASDLGIESEEKLRELIRQSLEEQLRYAQRAKVRDQISASLTESADWEIPPDLLRRQSHRELDRAVIEMRSSGFTEEEITVRKNALRKNIMEKTEILLKEHFILEKLAESEKIEDLPEDYEVEIAKLAIQQNDSPRRIRARLERSGQIDALRNMIIERKVIELITEHAKFKPIPHEFETKSKTSAIAFFVAGHAASDIPQAKYEESVEQPLPTARDRDRG
jgi:trigger factor